MKLRTLCKIYLSLIVLLAFPIALFGQGSGKSTSGKPIDSNFNLQNVNGKYIEMKDFFDPSSPTAGIQEAVDKLKPEGGTIFISPGTYKIRKSIFLVSGVYIVGSGEHSVIERIDSCIQRPLMSAGRKGDTRIQVNDVSGFFKGGEITIASKTFQYWECTNAMVMEINEKSLVIDRPLKRDYLPEDDAAVMNFFPFFTSVNADNIRIENLTIHGHMKPGSDFASHFVCSAIHFLRVNNSIIDKVTVKHFPSDGFSVQAGRNVSVTNCISEYNLGNGYHPGSTLIISRWTENIGRFNGGDGLFFCFNVQYATISDNRFYNNKKNGIGDLGQGGQIGDQMNVVSGNYCYNNNRSGIECTPGCNNIIVNNVCENNSLSEPGKWPGIYLKDTHTTIIQGNRCIGSKESVPGNKPGYGIFLVGKCQNNTIFGNIFTGFSGGISGSNLDNNSISQNISID